LRERFLQPWLERPIRKGYLATRKGGERKEEKREISRSSLIPCSSAGGQEAKKRAQICRHGILGTSSRKKGRGRGLSQRLVFLNVTTQGGVGVSHRGLRGDEAKRKGKEKKRAELSSHVVCAPTRQAHCTTEGNAEMGGENGILSIRRECVGKERKASAPY